MSGPGVVGDYNKWVIETFRANRGVIHGRNSFLLLTTIGARSGLERTTPLAYSTDGDRLVVVASNSGADTNPDWYHNLLAHPIVTVELGAERFQARASVATERERLYAQHARLLPGYSEYQLKTTRKIPVVLLERID